MSKKIIIIGASGHGKVVADIAKKNGYTDIAFLDDNKEINFCGDYPVIGTCQDAPKYKKCDIVVAIGDCKVRQRIQTWLAETDMHVVKLIHPGAIVADGVEIGAGTVVMAGAVINPGTNIGCGCIINTCSSVDHDCVIENFVHISIGARVAGTVKIGGRTWIGAGATIINNVDIIDDCMIGAGAVVIRDVVEHGTYIGVPAKQIH